MRMRSCVLVAALAVGGLGACGDGDEPTESSETTAPGPEAPLTKTAFIEQGDAVCAELEAAQVAIAPPASEGDFARFLGEILEPANEALDDFRALNPPDDGRDVYDALLTALEDGITNLEGARTAAENGDTITAEDLMAAAGEAGDSADAAAQAYGFEVCGQPDPDELSGEDDPVDSNGDPIDDDADDDRPARSTTTQD